MSVNLSIENGRKRIILSGSTLFRANEPLLLYITDNDGTLKIDIQVDYKTKKKDTIVDYSFDRNLNVIYIKFYKNNINKYSVLADPWLIGSSEGRQLLFDYHIHRLLPAGDLFQFNYSFYQGEEVNNG